MTDDSIFKLVEKMRVAQRNFFLKRGTLNDAMVLEKKVDIALQERKTGRQAEFVMNNGITRTEEE